MATSSSLVKTHSLPTACSNCLMASAKSAALTPGGVFISCSRFHFWVLLPSRSLFAHRFRPDAGFARGQDAVGIERVFNIFVQPAQGVAVEGVRVRNIAHER